MRIEGGVRSCRGRFSPSNRCRRTKWENIVGNSLTSLSANDPDVLSNVLTQKVLVHDPRLWNLNDPALYHTVSKIMSGDKVIDDVSTQFGIREARFDADKGFFLNGKSLKIKGVCLHHDAGPIGARPVPARSVWETASAHYLKQIGVNAIRTSHNPPDPVLPGFVAINSGSW